MRISALDWDAAAWVGALVHATLETSAAPIARVAGYFINPILTVNRPLALQHGLKRMMRFLRKMIRLAVRRILMRHHVCPERLSRIADQSSGISVTANEFRWLPKGQVQNVMNYQHLAITFGTGPDPDSRCCNLGRNHCCNFAGNAFEIDTSHAGPIQSHRIAHELFDALKRLSLNLVSAHHIYRLRSETNVAGDRDLRIDYAAYQIGAFLSTFHLHRFGAPLFHEARGIAQCLVRCYVKRSERHVGYEKRMLHPTPDGFGVMQHFVNRDRERVFVAQHRLGKRVAD